MRAKPLNVPGAAVIAAVCLFAASTKGATTQPLTEREWTIEGVTRKALVYAPATAATAPTPVVFAFHGHGGTMSNAAEKFAFHKLWPEAICVYMQGLPIPGVIDPEGKMAGWQKTIGDHDDRDLKFFDAVLAALKSECRVDEKRVYASGHSNGGGFTYLLWAARGDALAAVAASAGGAGRNLRALKPKPALHIACEQDKIVPFENQKRTIETVRKLNGCEPVGATWVKTALLTATLYPSNTGTPFVSVICPGPHRLPLEAPALIARFFKEQSLNYESPRVEQRAP